MMDTIIKWKDSDGKYQLFDNSEINHMSRDHAIGLFSGGVPVIAVESGIFITNSTPLSAQYRSQGREVVMIGDLQPSEEMFGSVGFLAGL